MGNKTPGIALVISIVASIILLYSVYLFLIKNTAYSINYLFYSCALYGIAEIVYHITNINRKLSERE